MPARRDLYPQETEKILEIIDRKDNPEDYFEGALLELVQKHVDALWVCFNI